MQKCSYHNDIPCPFTTGARVLISPQFEILETGLQNSGTVGEHCYEVFYNRDEPCENCAAAKVIHTHRAAIMPKQEESLDPTSMPCRYAYPIESDGKLEAVGCVDFNLPIMERLEGDLQRSRELLRNLLLSAVDCIIAADMSGKIFMFNDSAAEVFGYSKKEALEHLDVRDIYFGDTAYTIMKKLRSEEYGGKGKLKQYHVDVRGKNGERIPISLYASIIYESGREVATIGFFHDLRERIRIRKELEQTQLQLLQSEKMASLGKLSAGVAHQLNNPLGGIVLFAKLMMEEYALPEGADEDLRRILRDAERCRDIVKELLEFSRQTRQQKKSCDINRTITRTLFLLENQTLFHNIEIKKELAEALPPVLADTQQMNHLFMNIILNAAQAMAGKGILTIRTFWATAQNRAWIEISDTGPGIPEDVLTHIFEPFFTTKEEGEGTGLGLSLAYSIVQDHGGQIRAENREGGGGVFHIELPVYAKEL